MNVKHLLKATRLPAALLLCSLMAAVSCKKKEQMEELPNIKPQEFPKDLGIKDFKFPEDSTAIYGWLNNQDSTSITKHAWGLWTGLTAKSDQKYKDEDLMVFETWMGVKELAELSALGDKQGGCSPVKKKRTELSVPRQFIHAQILMGKNTAIDTASQVYETVSYNPEAACHATKNLLFNQSVLNKYNVKGGIGKIPAFPAAAITTKPTYFAGIPDENGLLTVPVWPGAPTPAKTFGYDSWGTYVFVDINNKQAANKKLVPVTTKNPTPDQIKKATCNVNDFLNYKLDKEAAAYLNLHQDTGNKQFKAGDYVLLVGMHVGTKEISNWTWQTYFWSYDQDNPFFPSSKFAADLRPKEIKGAAAHYAVAVAYNMVWPNQPINGGTNVGVRPLIAFNPYLEGGLSDLPLANKLNPSYTYGVQSNCMACHALATANPNSPYTADQYISMDDKTLFSNQVQLDFAWSIQGNINTKK